jgi:hypothetical protein
MKITSETSRVAASYLRYSTLIHMTTARASRIWRNLAPHVESN